MHSYAALVNGATASFDPTSFVSDIAGVLPTVLPIFAEDRRRKTRLDGPRPSPAALREKPTASDVSLDFNGGDGGLEPRPLTCEAGSRHRTP